MSTRYFSKKIIKQSLITLWTVNRQILTKHNYFYNILFNTRWNYFFLTAPNQLCSSFWQPSIITRWQSNLYHDAKKLEITWRKSYLFIQLSSFSYETFLILIPSMTLNVPQIGILFPSHKFTTTFFTFIIFKNKLPSMTFFSLLSIRKTK